MFGGWREEVAWRCSRGGHNLDYRLPAGAVNSQKNFPAAALEPFLSAVSLSAEADCRSSITYYFSPMSLAMVGSTASAQMPYPFSLGWSKSGMIAFGRVPSSWRNLSLMFRK